MVQNQWYHVGIGAPPILEPIFVGIGIFTGGTIWGFEKPMAMCGSKMGVLSWFCHPKFWVDEHPFTIYDFHQGYRALNTFWPFASRSDVSPVSSRVPGAACAAPGAAGAFAGRGDRQMPGGARCISPPVVSEAFLKALFLVMAQEVKFFSSSLAEVSFLVDLVER